MDKESKDKLIALSIAFLLTAMFAIPYFYIHALAHICTYIVHALYQPCNVKGVT